MHRVPSLTSSSNSDVHSCRNMLAPVKLPSPPMHMRLVMPVCTRLKAALRRPSRVMKSVHRALPITVPPYRQQHNLLATETLNAQQSSRSWIHLKQTSVDSLWPHCNSEWTNVFHPFHDHNCISAAYAVMRCPFVCLSHVRGFCQNE